MILDVTDTLTVLKLFEKYKGGWINATFIAPMLDIPKPRIKEILTTLANRGLIEQDKEYFYRFKENEQKMITAKEVREYQKE